MTKKQTNSQQQEAKSQKSMKLTKEQIQYIDDYLLRSGVTYWDVRMEILDHFILAIEEKMELNETSINEALLEVTTAFGNSVQERHLVNKDRTNVVFSGTFTNNKGFKALESEKRKQIRKQYLKQYLEQFQKNFVSHRFYIDFIFFTTILYLSAQFFAEWFSLIAAAWICLEIVRRLYTTNNFIAVSNSLHVDISSKVLCVFLVIVMNTYNFIGLLESSEHFFWKVTIMLLIYPIIKTSLRVHENIRMQYKKYHNLIA